MLLGNLTEEAQTVEIDGIWYYIKTYGYPEHAVVTNQAKGEYG